MRKLSMIAAFALACGLTLPASFASAEAPKGPTPGAAVTNPFGPAGNAFPEGAFSVVVNYSFADKDSWYDGGSSHSALNDNNVQNMATLKLRYGIGNGWDIRTTTPFMHADYDKGQDKNGIGDTIVVVRRQWFSQDEGYPVSFGAGLGLQIPTGSTDANGAGTGAWGLMPEIGVSYRFDNKRQLLEGGMNYLWRGKNENNSTDDIDAIDLFRIHARYVYALDKNWDLGVETLYEHAFESTKNGQGMGNSYTTWFAGPAVTYKIPAWKMSIGASAQMSLYQDYEARGALGEECRFEMKFIKTF